jgi:hypothetical protein
MALSQEAVLRQAVHAEASKAIRRGRANRSGYDWRILVPACWRVLAARGLGVVDGHVFQFGVYRGASMLELWESLRPVTYMWGFDSFRGLPQNLDGVPKWHEGVFRHDGRVAVSAALGTRNVGWVKGYYNESLRDGMVRRLGIRPARYVDMDADLYSSTHEALDFLLRNRLLVTGSLIGYDDIWVLPCANGRRVSPLEVGEGRAHAEMAARYDVEFACVAGACDLEASRYDPSRVQTGWGHRDATDGHFWGAIFLIQSIGRGRASAGFMGAQGVEAFRQSRACRGQPSKQEYLLPAETGAHVDDVSTSTIDRGRLRPRRTWSTPPDAPRSASAYKIREAVRRSLGIAAE